MNASSPPPRSAPRWLARLGSQRLCLAGMAWLAAAVVAGYLHAPAMTPSLVGACALLALNLLAALAVNPLLRRSLPLLVFHLALLALAVLAGAGRLTALEGRVELTRGVPFEGRLIEADAGALHPHRLDRLAFQHEGFEIDYAPGLRRGPTRNRVSWRDAQGRLQYAVIGDHHPLVLEGYRFYTTPNKGFAPLLAWQPEHGQANAGAVHLPSFPMHALRQWREWNLPDGRAVWVMLQFDDDLIDPAAQAVFRLPDPHRLVVRVGEQRAGLVPGERMALPGGMLVYLELRTWMGYKVFYDLTLPWLLAASLLAALALCAHYASKFMPRRARAESLPPAAGGAPTPQGAGDA